MKLKSLSISLFFVVAGVNQLHSAELSDEQKMLIGFFQAYKTNDSEVLSRDRVDATVTIPGGNEKDCIYNCNSWLSPYSNQLYTFSKKGAQIELISIGSHVKDLESGKKAAELNQNQLETKSYPASPTNICQMYTVEKIGDTTTISEGCRVRKIILPNERHAIGCQLKLNLNDKEHVQMLEIATTAAKAAAEINSRNKVR